MTQTFSFIEMSEYFMQRIFRDFLLTADFFKLKIKKKFFQEYNQCVKKFDTRSGPEVIKLLPTQQSKKFILLINSKMPTTVGISTCIGMIKSTSERLKARNFFICQ